VNSEELELSLRTEFENYLKGVLAEMRAETTEFQKRIEGEFERHRAEFDQSFRALAARFDAESHFDEAFVASVAEHLRLARDEGAKITANAFAEAEKLGKESAPAASFESIRDAIADISSKDSQSAILKALIQHTSDFAPRGAFFIVKNEHFVGWKVFGEVSEAAEDAIREIHFPVGADSILGTAIRSLATVDSAAGAHIEDPVFLDPLHFGHPDRMYAVPLVARGKGVAVMYADYGTEGVHLHREALEALVKVAGLTVELVALAHTARAEGVGELADAHQFAPEHAAPEPAPEPVARFEEPFRPTPPEPPGFAVAESFSYGEEIGRHDAAPDLPEPAEIRAPEPTFAPEPAHEPVFVHEPAGFQPEPIAHTETSGAMVFDSGGSIEPAAVEPASPFDRAAEEYAAAPAPVGGFEPGVQPVAQPPRLSDRPVDLPIEVADEERRLHNDARRFARLLVSEIKLYNEKKVIEGREASDLYDRLREAIDRSREMYDKRVQPPVAAKFDYFHYELVNSLADGDISRLGGAYPGASV
jgi:cell pole-organizing protein PopZ